MYEEKFVKQRRVPLTGGRHDGHPDLGLTLEAEYRVKLCQKSEKHQPTPMSDILYRVLLQNRPPTLAFLDETVSCDDGGGGGAFCQVSTFAGNISATLPSR